MRSEREGQRHGDRDRWRRDSRRGDHYSGQRDILGSALDQHSRNYDSYRPSRSPPYPHRSSTPQGRPLSLPTRPPPPPLSIGGFSPPSAALPPPSNAPLPLTPSTLPHAPSPDILPSHRDSIQILVSKPAHHHHPPPLPPTKLQPIAAPGSKTSLRRFKDLANKVVTAGRAA
ncbi:hypothetical protein M422DRAFT_244097 [Sphaerobolus stellatus SS14]|nr:hypothetical protein M422DRAFT_244097 [Sphaerobolus stellatus SS14]